MKEGPRTFSLKAGNRWVIRLYKGKPRVVMNQSIFQRRDKPIKPYDVLSIHQVRELAAWLNRYLNTVAPTQQSVLVAGARAHARGIDRNLTSLEASATQHDSQKGDK